jgi:phage repressor protein C with HTH and peptisase S24 domain
VPRGNTKGKSSSGGVADGPLPFRSTFADRLRWLMDQFPNRAEAGRIAGVTPEHLPSYLKGDGASPRFEAVAKLAAAKNVSLDWLATGEGPRSSADAEPDGFVAVAVQSDSETRYGEGSDAPPPMLFSRAWLKTIVSAPDAALRIVIHRGNSNAPLIKDGDTMLVDTTVQRIAEDGLYVFPRDGKFQARFAEIFVDGHVALRSHSPGSGVQTLSEGEAAKLQVLGRVRWRGGVV